MLRRLTDEESARAARYFPVACKAAQSFVRSYPHLEEEMRTAALMGLLHAVVWTDPEREGVYTTAVWRFVQNYCLSALKRSRTSSRDHRPHQSLPDWLEAVDAPTEDSDRLAVVAEMLQTLSERERDILCDRFVLEKSCVEIAADHYVTDHRIQVIIRQSLKQLRERFAPR